MILPKPATSGESNAVNEFGQPIGLPLKDWTAPQIPPLVTHKGRYCQLEPLNAARHAQDFWDAQSNDLQGASWTYMPFGPFASVDEFKQWSGDAERSSDTQFYFIVVDTHAVGFVAYTHIQPIHGVLELGVYFSPRLARTRASTEAFKLVISNAFDLGYRRLEWKCDSCNLPSQAAATRLGFTYEGLFRQSLVHRGRNRDTTWFSMIDCEWNDGLKRAYECWLEASNFDEQGQQKLKLSDLTGPYVNAKP